MNGACFLPFAEQLANYWVVTVTYNAHDVGTEFTTFDDEVKEIGKRLLAMGLKQFDVVLGTSKGFGHLNFLDDQPEKYARMLTETFELVI